MPAKLLGINWLILTCVLISIQGAFSQSKIRASEAFNYFPEKSESQFNQQVVHKTLKLSQDDFIILNRQDPTNYTLEKYNARLKKSWQTGITLSINETIEAFFSSNSTAILITHRKDKTTQQLYGHQINLVSGQKQEPVLLLEAPAKDRKISIAHSNDGSKILAYRYQTNAHQQIQDISSILYDATFNKIKDTNYNLSDLTGILSTDVKVSDNGEQYVALISDNMNRLTVRQYSHQVKEVKIMSVLVGGVFDGQKVYILDSKFKLMPNNILYGAVMTADEATGNYYSLKTVKFDFEANDMVFAEEFKFTQSYVDKVVGIVKNNQTSRLEDIYLTDLLLSADNQLIVIAEKKYTDGGENAPYYAKELHLFTYDEYMDYAWNSVLVKSQEAPASQAFSSISYTSDVTNNTLRILTLENQQNKQDLYLRKIDTTTGRSITSKALGLNLANDKNLAYVKEYTRWLSDNSLIVAARLNKKPSGFRLIHVELK